MAAEFSVVTTTAGSEEAAMRIIDALLAKQLAACVQMTPIRSFYVWRGVAINEQEQMLLIKAKTVDWPDVEATIAAAHDYETPEIARMDLGDVAPAYAAWMRESTR